MLDSAQSQSSLDGKFDALVASLNGDEKKVAAFNADPVGVLAEAGIPVVPSLVPPAGAAAPPQLANDMNAMIAMELPALGVTTNVLAAGVGAAEHVDATVKWWGVDIKMNEKMTQDIVDGITGAGSIGSAVAAAMGGLSIITAGSATVIGAAIGIIVAAKIAQIKITDNGKGVHWPISWAQWAVLGGAVPLGPAGVAAAGMAVLHPLRN